MSTIISFFVSHWSHVAVFLAGIFSKNSLSSLYTKIKSYFTTAEADVKKVV